MDFRFDIIADYLPLFIEGTLWTIAITIMGVLLGAILGLFIGIGKMMKNPLAKLPFVWYINFFRGTPLLVQIFIIHFGVMPLFMTTVNPIISGVVSLALNAAAYIAEIFRAGIKSIDRGQMEAARSLGMNHMQAMKEVILPQAVKRMIPPLGNEFIVLLKDSSLISLISVPELMYWGKAATGQYYRIWEPYLTVAFVYLVLTLSLTYLLNYVERRLDTE
ncbi:MULTISPECIES: amino acid ABC transporter permease [Bacillaceae]|jgi:polar amino acid transport system permease protein|uniref:Amino acid ABC transporter permease n=1 Tax=Metabacillus hrfriensis TaxID=3048891 RepID=A0ACD4RFN9_9BACI|nr:MULTISPECIES: amino acid ABC transporter permease [Bacillaceae]UOK59142.1 amino acid ABC transporter permease [Bacillus sp. OVS6]USK30020.1 amino acid ABC transporter permease [Bacillus sp. CMF21]MDQ0860741.1 glutamine transport system permease protein [Bacillus sp. V2I10]UAL53710.1 amino acid ABC transporter permease [Metabacillus dongyingensis]WHZ59264.1 amino acid ABC transporter permease [Metabacillus sp. CT-WN-B3]